MSRQLPVYPGIIPYQIDSQRGDRETGEHGSPRLLAIEPRPPSSSALYSSGPSSGLTLPVRPSDSHLTEQEVREKFYNYWEKQQARSGWNGHRLDQSSPDSQGGSQGDYQDALLTNNIKKPDRWARGSEFLAASWAFTLSLHSVWSLPVAVLQHGGVSFLLVYLVCMVLVGSPLLLLEMVLGQFSALPQSTLYRHLCPLLSGLGLSLCLQSVVRSLLDLSVLMWSGQSLYLLFSQKEIKDDFFYNEVLDMGESNLTQLGSLTPQLTLVLGVAAVTAFLLAALGTRAIGKVCMITVPVCFMLMVTLTIRACLAPGGPQGLLILLSPNWAVMKEPGTWLSACCQVVFSLQLGLGVISSYSAYNQYQHNIIRDCLVLSLGHLVWVLLATLLTFSLLGAAGHNEAINLESMVTDPNLVSITGQGLVMTTITLVETSLATMPHGWLWAGLLLLLVTLLAINSLLGHLDMITSCLVNIKSSLRTYRPGLSFILTVGIFLLSLLLATQGGLHIYHMIETHLANWPTILFSLMMVVATSVCHGTTNMVRDLTHLTKMTRMSPWISSHLTTIYYTSLPLMLMSSLVWSIYQLVIYQSMQPLSTFSLRLPDGWGAPLGWSLAFIPLSPIVFGALVHLIWGSKEVNKCLHLRQSIQPTSRWYRNQEVEFTSDEVNLRGQDNMTSTA